MLKNKTVGIIYNAGQIHNKAGGFFQNDGVINNSELSIVGAISNYGILNNNSFINNNQQLSLIHNKTTGTVNNYGEITNSGTILNEGMFRNNNRLSVNVGGSLTNYSGGSFENSILTVRGTVTNLGALKGFGLADFIGVYSGGLVDNQGTLQGGGPSSLSSRFFIEQGGTLRNSGSFFGRELTNYGTVEVTKGGTLSATVAGGNLQFGEILTGGTWNVVAGDGTASLTLQGGIGRISKIAANTNVLLGGANSSFGIINSAFTSGSEIGSSLIANAGTLAIADGRAVSHPKPRFEQRGRRIRCSR